MDTIKNYFSKPIFVIFCFLAISCSRCCYAVIEHSCNDSGSNYLRIEVNSDDKIVDKEKAKEIIEKFSLAAGKLCYLDLHNISITPEALQMLLDMIKNNKKFIGLVFKRCSLASGDIGKIALALRDNESLAQLIIVDGNINASNVSTLAEVLPTTGLLSLDLVGERKIGHRSVQIFIPILENTRLIHLNFGFGDFNGEPLVTAGGAAMLPQDCQTISEILKRKQLINGALFNIFYRLRHREITGDPELSWSLSAPRVEGELLSPPSNNSVNAEIGGPAYASTLSLNIYTNSAK